MSQKELERADAYAAAAYDAAKAAAAAAYDAANATAAAAYDGAYAYDAAYADSKANKVKYWVERYEELTQ